MRGNDLGEVRERKFEDELALLEKAVERLESGELGLEDAMREFESGFRSWKRCREILSALQQRIEVLCEEAGGDDVRQRGTLWKPASSAGMSQLGVSDPADLGADSDPSDGEGAREE